VWTFKGKEFTSEDIPEGAIGFVYRITNPSGQKYIGQKRFFKPVVKPPLKGQTRKRRSIAESDWKKYVGSSKEVQQQVKDLGIENFGREILEICFSKGMLSYTEAKLQFDLGVLFDDSYLNGIIQTRINKTHVKGVRDNDRDETISTNVS